MLSQRKNDFEHIKPFRKGEFFQLAFGIKRVPSVERLRQRFDLLAQTNLWGDIILDESARLPKHVGLTPSTLQVPSGSYVPVDVDVFPYDNSGSKKKVPLGLIMIVTVMHHDFAYTGHKGYGLH